MRTVERSYPTATAELLRTKLVPPRVRAALVARPSLLARLDAGLDHKLTLVSAPAGFGKTTLVSTWIATHTNGQDPPPVGWVALDTGDNDPVRFWRYVIAACRALDEAIGRTSWALLDTSQPPHIEAVLTALLNELAQLSHRCILVLEDYHLITAAQIHDAVAFLLDHLPATLHLVIITRTDPPLPLARLRAHHELHELGAADLRFSLAETTTFLQQALPVPLAAETIARLDARTEGWAAGLRLLTLALQGRTEPREIEQVLATFSGTHEHVVAYLVDDVLHAQPEPLQAFLLQTSVLNRLTASLCDAVTGRTDSDRVLQRLDRANVFLLPLDDKQQWFRYHALFAQAMQHEARRRLGAANVRAVYATASRWYEQHALWTEAVEAALAAGDMERAAVLIERVIAPQLVKNEHHTLRRWLAQVPPNVLQHHPALCLSYASAILFTSERRAPATMALLHPPLMMAEQRWRTDQQWAQLGAVLALRAMATWWQGNLAQSFAAAREALAMLPEGETQWRGISLIFVGAEHLLAGQISTARQTILDARALSEAAGNSYGILSTTHLFGNVCAQQGELRQADQLYRQALAAADALPNALDNKAQALLGLGALRYEWNNLDAAEQHAAEVRDLGHHLGDDEFVVQGSLLLVRVQQARGDMAHAQQVLHTLAAQTPQRWPLLLRQIRTAQARLALAAGDIAAAQRWHANVVEHHDAIPRMHQEQEALVVARMLLAQRNTSAALHLLGAWQTEAQAHGRIKSEVEITILTALAHAAADELPQAKHTLSTALQLAQAEGYQRLFLDEGAALAALLRTLMPDVREEPVGSYVHALLGAFEQEQARLGAAPAPCSTSLIEPLSPQEQRVLRLLAAGLSNAEIAQELIVSVNTIKTQLKSIYRKLDVSSRDEARSAAREFHLF
jgi:LuxR family maltose regulon positive regulatory protein